MTVNASRRVRRAAVPVLGLLCIAAATLVPLPRQTAASAATPLWCLVCGDYGGVDVLQNILLFIPLGVGLRISGLSTPRVWACGLAISLLVETLQLTVIPGRDASLSDLFTNSLGSWVGALAGAHRARLLFPAPRGALHLALAAATVWLGVQTTSAVLLRPWAPSDMLEVVWGRSAPGRPPFEGTVTSATLSGSVVPDGSKSMPPELATRIRQGDIRLEVRLRSGGVEGMWSPVFELLGPAGPVLSIEAVGRDLAFQPAMHSYRLRFRRPALRLPDALPREPGTPVRVETGERRGTIWARWRTGQGEWRSSFQVLGPSLGWSLFTPFRYAFGPETRWLTSMWIAGWLAVAGYWWAGSRVRPLAAVAAVALLLIVGLGLIPASLGYPPVHWTEWLAGAAGLGIGYAGHHFAAYLGERCDPLSIKESS